MIQRLKPWYPFFFALLPILNTLTRNPGGTRLDDAAVVAAVVLLGWALVYLLVRLLFRGPRATPLVPLLVLAVVIVVSGKSGIGSLGRQIVGVSPSALLALILGCIGLGVWWLSHRPQALDRVNTFFTLTGLLMVVWLGFRLVADQIESRSMVRRSGLARTLSQPVGVNVRSSIRRVARPDIYLMVLDEYANSEVLKEQFQFDNRVFEDSLRRLGFTIPALVRSNYVHTVLSLPSLLNFSHLTSLAAELGERSTDATLPNHLLENSRTVAFLKGQGYRFLFFPSQWWPSTTSSSSADWQFEAWDGFDLGREATRSDFRRSFLSTTALSFLGPAYHWDADHVKRTLAALADVPQRAEPTFAFAHLLSPHWPYVLAADCTVAKPAVITGRAHRQRAYLDQLQCLNRLLLGTVSAILERSSSPPIIILQGDHGTNLLRYSDAPSAGAVTPDQARERFGAFGAYHVPHGGGRLFTNTVTMVNVFQKVLSFYFGARIEPAADDLYLSLERTPYRFVKVDPRRLRH
jgi:Sulfatase